MMNEKCNDECCPDSYREMSEWQADETKIDWPLQKLAVETREMKNWWFEVSLSNMDVGNCEMCKMRLFKLAN